MIENQAKEPVITGLITSLEKSVMNLSDRINTLRDRLKELVEPETPRPNPPESPVRSGQMLSPMSSRLKDIEITINTNAARIEDTLHRLQV